MPKVNINSREFQEDNFPKRGRISRYNYDYWRDNNNGWTKCVKLYHFMHSQIDKPFNDTYKEVIRRVKEDKQYGPIRKSAHILEWMMPDEVTKDRICTSPRHASSIWKDKVYIDPDGILRRGSYFKDCRDFKEVLGRIGRMERREVYLKNLHESKKIRRQRKAMDRYCEKGNEIFEAFLRRELDFALQDNRWRNNVYQFSYDTIVRRMNGLNEFYDLPFRFVHPFKREVYTNVEYKRFMK